MQDHNMIKAAKNIDLDVRMFKESQKQLHNIFYQLKQNYFQWH